MNFEIGIVFMTLLDLETVADKISLDECFPLPNPQTPCSVCCQNKNGTVWLYLELLSHSYYNKPTKYPTKLLVLSAGVGTSSRKQADATSRNSRMPPICKSKCGKACSVRHVTPTSTCNSRDPDALTYILYASPRKHAQCSTCDGDVDM